MSKSAASGMQRIEPVLSDVPPVDPSWRERAHQKDGDPLGELARMIGDSDPFADYLKAKKGAEVAPRPRVTPMPAAMPPRPVAVPPLVAAVPPAPKPAQPPKIADAGWADLESAVAEALSKTSQGTARPQVQAPRPVAVAPAAAPQAAPADFAADDRLEDPYVPAPNAEDSYRPHAALDRPADAGAERRRARGGLATVGVVLGLAVIGTAGAFAYKSFGHGPAARSGEPPVIRAATAPTKIMPTPEPETGTTKTTFDRTATDKPGAEKMVSREEQPASQPVPLAKPGGPETGTLPGADLRRVRTVAIIAPGQPIPPPPAEAPPAAAPAADAQPVAPPPVVAAAPAPAAPPAAVTPSAEAPPPALAPRPRPQAERIVAGAPKAEPPAPKIVAPAAPKPAAPKVAAPVAPKAAPKHAAPVRTAAVTPPGGPTALAPAAAAPAPGGSFLVQVSSQKSDADARKAFAAMKRKFSALGPYQPNIRQVDLGARGKFYRVRVGPLSSNDANQLCKALKSQGGDCIVQKN